MHRLFTHIFTLSLVVLLVALPTLPAHAGLFGISMPSPSGMLSDFENRYHINQGSLQSLGETLNVSENKQPTPEVQVIFSPTDPKPGEKITANAFPMNFRATAKNLYFTWYLKRSGCQLDGSPSAATQDRCDLDDDEEITVNDWKLAASRLIAVDGADGPFGTTDQDSDGYRARFGGEGVAPGSDTYCYAQDYRTGKTYELVRDEVDTADFYTDGSKNSKCDLSSHTVACIIPNEEFKPDALTASGSTTGTSTGGAGGTGGSGGATPTGGSGGTSGSTTTTSTTTVSGGTFQVGGTTCTVAGSPYCDDGGNIACDLGVPVCLDKDDKQVNITCATAVPLLSCDSNDTEQSGFEDKLNGCYHLFAEQNFDKKSTKDRFSSTSNAQWTNSTGNASFNAAEEAFFTTNPADPDTADNGNKDEANAAGLGAEKLTWNYAAGDQVGVVVEGESLAPTKHDNGTYKIMWGWPKKTCSPTKYGKVGNYSTTIRNYKVRIPVVQMDLDKCIPDNLLDPLQGGQATKLELVLSATPDTPVNDALVSGNTGDRVDVRAGVTNTAKELKDVYYEWSVDIAKSGVLPIDENGWQKDIQNDADIKQYLSPTKGPGVSSVAFGLNIKNDTTVTPNVTDSIGGQGLQSYLSGGIGYLRFRVKAAENFGNTETRRGKSDVIVKFVSTQEQIRVYRTNVDSSGKLVKDTTNPFCTGLFATGDSRANDPLLKRTRALENKICPVLDNEIVALQAPVGQSYQWIVNGEALQCNSNVSTECSSSETTSTNFLPIRGNAGDIITLNLVVNRFSTDTAGTIGSAERSMTLTRAFQIVTPTAKVSITSGTASGAFVLLGQYKDPTGDASAVCPGGLCPEFSDTAIEANAGQTLKLTVTHTPSFLDNVFNRPESTSQDSRRWVINGDELIPNDPTTDNNSLEIAIDADSVGRTYNVLYEAAYTPRPEIRKALSQIYGVSAFSTVEQYISKPLEISVVEDTAGTLAQSGGFMNRALASVGLSAPASVVYTVRVFLMLLAALIVVALVQALIPAAARVSRSLETR